MVAMLVLEASAEMRESSSLSPGTILKHIAMPFRGGDQKESSVFQYGSPTNCDTGTQMPGSGYHKENRKCAFCL